MVWVGNSEDALEPPVISRDHAQRKVSKHPPIETLKGNRESQGSGTFLTPGFREVDAVPAALSTSAAEGAARILRAPAKTSRTGQSGVTAVCPELPCHTSIT